MKILSKLKKLLSLWSSKVILFAVVTDDTCIPMGYYPILIRKFGLPMADWLFVIDASILTGVVLLFDLGST